MCREYFEISIKINNHKNLYKVCKLVILIRFIGNFSGQDNKSLVTGVGRKQHKEKSPTGSIDY